MSPCKELHKTDLKVFVAIKQSTSGAPHTLTLRIYVQILFEWGFFSTPILNDQSYKLLSL